MENKNPKVFKMGDNSGDWVVAHDKKSAISWYEDEVWVDIMDESSVEEVDKEKDGWVLPLSGPLVRDDIDSTFKNMLRNNESINAKIEFRGKLEKKLYIVIPFKEIIEKDNNIIPSIICSIRAHKYAQ